MAHRLGEPRARGDRSIERGARHPGRERTCESRAGQCDRGERFAPFADGVAQAIPRAKSSCGRRVRVFQQALLVDLATI